MTVKKIRLLGSAGALVICLGVAGVVFRQSLIEEEAQPSDYALPHPVPEPDLPANFDPFSPSRYGGASGPQIGEWTRTGGPNETITFAGPDFNDGSEFRIFKQTTAQDAQLYRRKINAASGSGATLTLPAGLGSWATYFIWPVTSGKAGLPVAVNRTDGWWLGPNETTVGEKTAIYGRNLARNNGLAESYIYIKPAVGAGQWVPATSVNPYRVEFQVPTLTPGEYEVWIHNGHGGHFGWSGPKALTILAQSPFAGHDLITVNVKDHGAKGDDATDDTAAIQSALKAAQAKGPSTLYFPAGIYISNGTLVPPPDVTWRGDGADRSILKVGANFPGSTESSFILSGTGPGRVEFKALSIDNNGHLGKKHLISLRRHRHLRFTDVKLVAGDSTLDVHDNQYMVLKGCTIVGGGAFLGNSRQVTVEGTTFRMTNMGPFALASWGGEEIAVVNNIAQDDDPSATTPAGVGTGRFFVSQGHFGSSRNLYFAHNQTINFASPKLPGVDTNQGEQFLFEMPLVKMSEVPSAVGPSSVTFAQPAPYLGLDAVIVKGRGVGQTRRIVGVRGNTIDLSPPFRVLPDKSSIITITGSQNEAVIYQNKLDGKDGYIANYSASVGVNLWGNASNNIMANNVLTRIRGGIAVEWVWKDTPNVPNGGGIFFNLVSGNSLDGGLGGFTGFTKLVGGDSPQTIGHLGNTYRSNTLKNLGGAAIDLGVGSKFLQGREGAGFSHIVFEQNTFSGVEPVVRILGGDNVKSLHLINNTFLRVAATTAGDAMAVDTLASDPIFFSGNKWSNFSNSPEAGNHVPTFSVVREHFIVSFRKAKN